MKGFAVFVLLPAVCVAFFDHEVIARRAKRQVQTFSDLRSLNCLLGCLQKFKQDVAIVSSEADQLSSDVDETALHSKQKIDKFCGTYSDWNSCVNECGSDASVVTRNVVQMFKPLKMICNSHYEEFISYLPCYSVSSVCTWPESDSDFTVLVEKMCDFADCHHRHESPIIVGNCPGKKGQDAADFLKIFIDAFILRLVNAMKFFSPEVDIPEMCQRRLGKKLTVQ